MPPRLFRSCFRLARCLSFSLVLSAFAATASAAEPVHFSVQVTGKGRPVVLIPGLTCNGSIWQPTAERLQGNYELHIVSIAGFGGKPAVAGELLPAVQRELLAYLRAKQLKQPLIVGHSLGGFLALWVAASAPELVGAVVAVDGVPFLPALQQPTATAEAMKEPAEQLRRFLGALDAAAFAAQNKMTLRMMVRDTKHADRLAEMTSKSEPAAVARAMSELMTIDLRGQMSKIKVPVLAMIPSSPAMPGLDAKAIQQRYRDQFAPIPHCRIEFLDGVRHFIMVDAPDTFHRLLESFLQNPTRFVADQAGKGGRKNG